MSTLTPATRRTSAAVSLNCLGPPRRRATPTGHGKESARAHNRPPTGVRRSTKIEGAASERGSKRAPERCAMRLQSRRRRRRRRRRVRRRSRNGVKNHSLSRRVCCAVCTTVPQRPSSAQPRLGSNSAMSVHAIVWLHEQAACGPLRDGRNESEITERAPRRES